MSLETWKAEFYPVPADKVSAKDAVAHSLRKWEGLRPENLTRHGLEQRDSAVAEPNMGDSLSIDWASCALCRRYADDHSCGECPLFLARDEVQCDQGIDDPYHAFRDLGNPEPMIMWLKKAKEYEDGRHAGPDPTDAQLAAHAEGHGRASDPRP